MKSRSRKKGFTLVELLVVISIIALLLAIIIPSMNKARETAKRVICSNQEKEIARAISMYADAYNGWLPFYGGWDPTFDPPYNCVDTGTIGCPRDESHPYAAFRANEQWCQNGDVTKPYPMKLGCLVAKGIITVPKMFYCPGNKEEQYQFESYYHPKPWGSLPQDFNVRASMNQWVRVSYTYFPVDPTARKETNGALKAPIHILPGDL